jgi:prolipoprotein diacylglyceryltransferase
MQPRHAYTLFMLLAAATFVLARALQPRPPALAALPWRQRVVLMLAAFTGGSLGSKLWDVPRHAAGWLSPEAWFADGKTITLGLMGAYVAVELAKLALGVRVKTGDSFALPLALALAVGRWGCFFNGCCHGTGTDLPWGVDFLGDGPRHPTQVYEVLFHGGMAFVLYLVARHGLLVHQRLKLYLIAYGAYRFLTEFIRPEPEVALGLTFYQWAALVMIVGLAVQWRIDLRSGQGSGVSRKEGACLSSATDH